MVAQGDWKFGQIPSYKKLLYTLEILIHDIKLNQTFLHVKPLVQKKCEFYAQGCHFLKGVQKSIEQFFHEAVFLAWPTFFPVKK